MTAEATTKERDMSETTYEVDAAMMGDQWVGHAINLFNFCHELQCVVGDEFEIKPVISTFNGATASDDGPTEEQWGEAVDRHAETYPESWRA
jgi:hypothetical protein